jgi:hypothetical protein
MKQELRWRVTYGYKPNEYISISEDYLERAKYAMISGKNFACKGRIIRGSEIKRIEEDFRYYTGWSDEFNPSSAEDQQQIMRDAPINDLRLRSELADRRVSYIAHTGQTKLLADVSQTDKLLLK